MSDERDDSTYTSNLAAPEHKLLVVIDGKLVEVMDAMIYSQDVEDGNTTAFHFDDTGIVDVYFYGPEDRDRLDEKGTEPWCEEQIVLRLVWEHVDLSERPIEPGNGPVLAYGVEQ